MDIIQKYYGYDFGAFFKGVSDKDIARIISKPALDESDFLALLSAKAGGHLEAMAQRSHELTLMNFGKVIGLYAPLYLANFCDNDCLYCGFKRANPIKRKKLSLSEVEKEAKVISRTGIRHILILTGESRQETPVDYLKNCILVLKEYFASIAIEVYPMESREYRTLIEAGADALTLYQETYDQVLYARLHPRGPKKDFLYRLLAPERACAAGMRGLNIGALIGLSDFRKDIFFLGLHAADLQKRFPRIELGLALPRVQPTLNAWIPSFAVGDRELTQAMTALRIFLPKAGITISTRENKTLRGRLIGLGVTRMSAGSKTEVGGYSLRKKTKGQFEIADTSTVAQVKKMIYAHGYQPVLKDWQAF